MIDQLLGSASSRSMPTWLYWLVLVPVVLLLIYKGYVLLFRNPDMRTEDMEKEKRKLWRLFR